MTATTTPSAPSLNVLQADCVEALLPVLQASPALNILSCRQRTLDSLDIEGLAALWTRIYPGGAPFGDGAAEPTLEEWARFVDTYLARCGSEKAGTVPGEPGESGEAELRHHCLAYLLSATFKDCSIVIRFLPRLGPSEHPSGQAGDEHTTAQDTNPHAAAQAEVKLIDLDVKSIKRLAKWEKMDRDIVSAYAQVKDPRTCVDSLAGRCSVP